MFLQTKDVQKRTLKSLPDIFKENATEREIYDDSSQFQFHTVDNKKSTSDLYFIHKHKA